MVVGGGSGEEACGGIGIGWLPAALEGGACVLNLPCDAGWESAGCCAATLTESNQAAPNIHFQVGMNLSPDNIQLTKPARKL
jgi:hypothetical protein